MAPNSGAPSLTPSSSSFVTEDNLCGTTLLRLVCRGHTLIAELRALSEQIPSAFLYAAAAAATGNDLSDAEMAEFERGVGGLLKKTGDAAKKDSATPAAAAGSSVMSPLLQSSSATTGAGSESSYLFSYFSSTTKPSTSGAIASTGTSGGAASSGSYFSSMLSGTSSSAGGTGTSAAGVGGNDGNKMGGTAGSDKRYQSFLFDFIYLRNPEEFEAKIAAQIPIEGGGTESAEELEAEFALTHREILTKFYKLFEGIYKYQLDLNHFATDLAKGYYIQYTVDSVLLDTEGRQLLCEAVHLYGVLLMLMEYYIQGSIRERLVIAFYRYCGKDGSLQHIDDVCKLCRSMGGNHPFPSNTWNKPPLGEEKLFSRFPLPTSLVRNIVGSLISDDLYLQSQSFPNFDQRSTRLSRQAAMLYVILFFDPNILLNDEGLMREIVDKFFNDNWVIAAYMGMTVDLSVDWMRFPAAKAALDNVLQAANVRRVHISNAKLIGQCMAELRGYLVTGILTDTFVLDNTNDLLNCMRRCNVAIRWRILHRRTRNKEFHDIICATNAKNTSDPKLEGGFAIHVNHVVSAILLTSQLELKLKYIFEDLLDKKGEIWDTCRTKAAARMMELSRYFEGDRTLRSVERNEGLMKWFASMAVEIESLSCENEEHFTVTGRRIQLCIQALKEIEEFDAVDRDMQVKAVLKEARALLLQMVRAVSIKDDVVVIVHSISDMTYATDAICHLIPVIQRRIRKDPSNVALLQGLFIKLKSVLDTPTARLRQIKSQSALNKVTDYYAKVIVSFIRTVLEIVPVSVFAILMEIVDIKEWRLKQLPVKVEIDNLLEYAQLDERHKLAMLTQELSIFTEGILAMEKTAIGRDVINPRNILEDGLRKELVRQCCAALHHNLQFQFNIDALPQHQAACIRSLSTLAGRMDGFRSAIEYIQDFIDIPGLMMWGEEVARIIGYNVEQEANKYLLKKVFDFESKYQTAAAPIPNYPRTESDPLCVNFMGRTVSTLLKMTDAQTTIFSRECSGWFLADGQEVCGFRTISLLRRAIGVCGLSGIDKLLSFRIMHELHRFVKFFKTTVKKQGVLLEQIRDGLFPEWRIPANDSIGFYASATKKTEMLMMPVMTCLRRVGQAQLLRKMIHNELQTCARIDASKLQHTLSTLNEAIMSNAMVSCRTTNDNVLSEKSINGIQEVRDLIDTMGEGDPISTAFLQIDPLEGLPVLLALFVISYMPKFKYDSDFGALVRSNEGYPIDGWPVVVGMATLLKQFHPSYTDSVLAYLGQYVRSSIYSSSSRKQSKKEDAPHLSETATHTLIFACHLCSISKVPRSVLYEKIPQYLIEICAQH